MEYRVEELASAAGIRVDTLRFYQSKGLLPRPARRGRHAIYDPGHLERLREIRSLVERGFSLAQVARILEGNGNALESDERARGAEVDSLLGALVEEGVGERTFSRAELAAEAGVPEVLIQAVEAAGLGEGLEIDGEARFTTADLEMARAALAILGAGFPMASRHAEQVREIADGAIDLFDAHIRKAPAAEGSEEKVSEAFRILLPQITRLVALHFQHTLVNRALGRLAAGGDEPEGDLRRALATTQSGRLEIQWR